MLRSLPLLSGLLAASLLLTLPLLGVGRPGALLGVEIADFVAAHFGLAGLVALVTLRLRWPEALAGASGHPGRLLDAELTVACGEGALRLLEVQKSGKAPVEGAAFLRGARLAAGTLLPDAPETGPDA